MIIITLFPIIWLSYAYTLHIPSGYHRSHQLYSSNLSLRKNVDVLTPLTPNPVEIEKQSTKYKLKLRKPEILAPAGGWPQLKSAAISGADAVYFGLDSGMYYHYSCMSDNYV